VLSAAAFMFQIISERTIGLISGCGTASNLWYCSFRSGPTLIYAPLFSVVSQYFGAEKTVPFVRTAYALNGLFSRVAKMD
jgi:hypothetical protein